MLSSIILSSLTRHLDAVFSNTSSARRQPSSSASSEIFFRDLDLKPLLVPHTAASLSIDASGSVAELSIRLSIPANPLQWADSRVHVRMSGIHLECRATETTTPTDKLFDTSADSRDLRKILETALLSAMTELPNTVNSPSSSSSSSSLSDTISALPALSLAWILSRTEIHIEGLRVSGRSTIGQLDGEELLVVLAAEGLDFSHGDSSSPTPGLLCRLHLRSVTAQIPPHPDSAPCPLLLNPLNASVSVTLSSQPCDSSSSTPTISAAFSVRVDRIEATVVEEQLSRVARCLDGAAAAADEARTRRSAWIWRRLIYRRRCRLAGARPDAHTRWHILVSCLRPANALPPLEYCVRALQMSVRRQSTSAGWTDAVRDYAGTLSRGEIEYAARSAYAGLEPALSLPRPSTTLSIGRLLRTAASHGLASLGLKPAPALRLLASAVVGRPHNWEVKVSVTVSRIALSLFDGLGYSWQPIHSDRRRPMMHAVCYGLQTLALHSQSSNEVFLRVGKICCFGAMGETIFSCGKEESAKKSAASGAERTKEKDDKEKDDKEKDDKEKDDKVQDEDEDEDDEEDDALADCALQSQLRSDNGSANLPRLFVELSVSPIKIFWNERAHLDFHRVFSFASPAPSLSPLLTSSGRSMPLVSCDISVEQVYVDMPLRQFHLWELRDTSLLLSVGPLVVKAGRFIEDAAVRREILGCKNLPDRQTFSLSLSAVQLTMSSLRFLKSLVAPWTVLGAVTLSRCDNSCRVSLKLSDVAIVLSDTQMLNVLEVAEMLTRRWVRAKSAPSSISPHRVKASSSLITTVDLRLSSVSLVLVPHIVPLRRNRHTYTSLLTAFEQIVSTRGVDSRVAQSHQAILERRLAALRMDKAMISCVIDELLRQPDDVCGVDVAARALEAIGLTDALPHGSESTMLVSVSIQNLRLSGDNDKRGGGVTVEMGEISLLDSSLLPVVVARTSTNDEPSLRITWTPSPEPLVGSETPHISFKASRLDIRLASDFQKDLDALHRALMPVFVKALLLADFFKSKASSDNETIDAFVMGSVALDVGLLEVLLIHADNHFALIELNCLKVEVVEKRTSFTVRASSADPEITDLTEMGALHSVVLWGGEDDNKRVTASYDSEDQELMLELCNIRVCLLNRFLQETFIFYDHAVLRSYHSLEAMWREAVTAWEVPLVWAEDTASNSDQQSYDSSDEEGRLYLAHAHMVSAVVLEKPPAPSQTIPTRFRLRLDDAVVYMPRNSTSRDVFALTINSALLHLSQRDDSWPTPTESEESNQECHRYFDTNSNKWCYSVDGGLMACQTGCIPEQMKVTRGAVHLSGCQAYSCVGTTLPRSSSEEEVSSEEYILLAEVDEGGPVFVIGSMETGAIHNSTQLWRRVSQSMHLLVVADSSPAATRILLSDTEIFSPLNLKVSLADFYLILSLFYGKLISAELSSLPFLHYDIDNFTEVEQFFERSNQRVGISAAEGFDTEYGTQEYFDFFKRQTASFELLFMRESLAAHFLFDAPGYFAEDPPTQTFVSSAGSAPRSSYPLAGLHLQRVVLHYKSNDSSSQVSFNAGGASIVDETSARSSVKSTVLELDSRDAISQYGFSCFNYCLVGSVEISKLVNLPISVNSYYNCLNQFRTTTVTMLSPEICLNSLHLLWMLIDYFTLYFSNPVYGNPYSVPALIPKEYMSVSDLRIMFIRPLVLSLKELHNKDTQYLLLESESFVSYRIMQDSSGARKVQVEGGDVALVIVRQLRDTNRGLRGASGSGRGIRTIVEHLDFHVIYHVSSFPLTSDISIEVTSCSDGRAVNFDWDTVVVPQSIIMESTCVENVDVVSRIIPTKTLDFVASFEDTLVCLSILSGFFSEEGGNSSSGAVPYNMFCVVKISAQRIVIVDNVVGLHLPLFQLLFDEISLTLDGTSLLPDSSSEEECSRYNLFVGLRGFADYFNYSCKCWEPLLEPIICEVIYEQSRESRGLSLRSKSNIHINVSGACLKAVHELLRVVHEDIGGGAAALGFEDTSPQRSSSISNGYYPLIQGSVKNVLHLPSQCLRDDMRVGFSILNATGQSLRYLVDHGEDRKVVRYLKDGQRGILNFPATQFLIRNGSVYEESFDLQREEGSDRYDRLRRMRIGHLIGLQISGYRWIETEADVLGARYERLTPVVETLNASNMFPKEWKSLNALTLLAEVTSTAGGRLLRLRSVFEIKNKTHHRLHVLLSNNSVDSSADPRNSPFTVEAGDVLYIPIALLHDSMLKSNGKELGFVRVRPADVATVKVEASVKSNVTIKDLKYSAEPISLVKLVENSFELLQAAATASGKYADENLQLVCHINSELKESRLAKSSLRAKQESSTFAKIPPFIYNIEVTRNGAGYAQVMDVDAEKTFADMFFKQYIKRDDEDLRQHPLHYQLILQPPIVLQNLLPAIGKFTIINTVTKSVLWSKFLGCGESTDIHTLSLQEPLTLLINLGYCRTIEGARIHVPSNHKEKGMASIQRTIEGFLEEDIRDKTLWLADFVGQKLKLQIENEVGGGGQRSIKIFTPFWLINTSQYVLRFREELSEHFPAGTVSASKDGTKSVPGGDEDEFRRANIKTIFPGKPGPLTEANDIMDTNEELCSLLGDLSVDSILQLAYMFNFNQSQRRMRVQLDDSKWSRPFSLDSVGVHQELSIEREQTGNLEVGFRIDLAPGIYGKHTRVVRFSPRFVIVNTLPFNVGMCQPTGVVGEYDSSFSVLANHRKAFHLPCVFGKRKLGLQLEGPWTRSVMFSVDMTGEFTLLVKKEINLASVEHIVTRPPRFNVWLPSQELGVWFETDWKQQEIVVKAIRAGLYASNYTEIQVGDVLLSVNGIKAEGKNFDTIMHLLKKSNRGADPPISGQQYAEFMSSEEKLARIRRDAVIHKQSVKRQETPTSKSIEPDEPESELAIKLSLHIESATMFIVMRLVETGTPPEYLIVNQSPSHSIIYKQRGLNGNRWLEIEPGDSCSYFWEHPLMKQRALLVQVGKSVLTEQELVIAGRAGKNAQAKRNIDSRSNKNRIERTCLSILLDDIGQVMSMATSDPVLGKLVLRIYIRGPTKVLEISPEKASIPSVLKYCEDMILEQQSILSRFRELLVQTHNPNFESRIAQNLKMMHDSLRSFQKGCFDICGCSKDDSNLQNIQYQQSHISVFGTAITKRGQIIVRILEAKELKSLLMQGKYTYCKIMLTTQESTLFKDYTYRTDEIANPFWMDEMFLINVPETAASSTSRVFMLSIIVHSSSFIGVDRFLGRVDIPLGVLKSQERMKGWFALRPNASSIKYSTNTLKVSGSLKLSVQWVYSMDGLAHSLRNSTEKRLVVLDKLNSVCEKIHNSLDAEERLSRKGATRSSHFDGALADSLLSYVTDTSAYFRKKVRHWAAATRDKIELTLFERSESSYSPFGSHTSSLRVQDKQDVVPMFDSSTNSDKIRSSRRVHGSFDGQGTLLLPIESSMPSPSSSLHRVRRSTVVTVAKKNLVRGESETFFQMMPMKITSLNRIRGIVEYQQTFVDRFDEESRRNQNLVDASVGSVTFTVIEAQNLPIMKFPIMIKIGYGDLVHATHSVLSPGSEASWIESDFQFDLNETGIRNLMNKFKFEVDTLNIRGLFRVSVVADTFPSVTELASLELPFFSILSTIVLHDEGPYERWFPLCPSNQSIPVEGETGTMSHYLQRESNTSSDFGLKPCIKLGLKWSKEDQMHSDPDARRSAYAIASVPACSLAIINSEKSQEVLEISMQNLDVRYSESKSTTEASVNLVWLQVDNQLPQSTAPVILCPTLKINAQPIIRFILRKSKVLSHRNLSSYESVELIIQELDIFLEQKQVIGSWNLLQSWLAEMEHELETVTGRLIGNEEEDDELNGFASPSRERRGGGRGGSSVFSSRRSLDGFTNKEVESKKIYIENFLIGPVKMNVSFIISPDVYLKQSRVNGRVEKGIFSGDVNNLYYAFTFLARQIGDVVLDLTSAVTDAPIELNCLQARHLFKTDFELTKTLQEHYLTSFLKQLYKIVGSLDLVGNPIGIVSSLGVGVRDFFFEPTHALITNPTEIRKIGRGVVKGTLSLVSNVSEGTIGTLSTITRAAGRGVARLSLGDSQFLKRREELMKRPKSLFRALIRPMIDIENGVSGGLIGLIKVPYNGAKRNGLSGFMAGIPMAAIGLVAKPVVGVLDAVSHITESLGDGVKVLAKETQPPLRRRRLSNLFGPDGRVMAYSRTNALGTYILQMTESSRWRLQSSHWWAGVYGDREDYDVSSRLFQSQYGSMPNVLKSVRLNPRRPSGVASDLSMFSRSGLLSRALKDSKGSEIGSVSSPDMIDVAHPYQEFVVYTSILQKTPGSDFVVILSTERVVVASYKRFSATSHIKTIWQCLLRTSRMPLLNSSGASTILTLRAETEENEVTKNASSEFEIQREHNDFELINIYNVLNALLKNFNYFIKNTSTVVNQNVEVTYDSVLGIMRVGPWEFAKEIDVFDDDGANDNTPLGKLRETLESSSWTDHDSEVASRGVPQWLEDIRMAAVASHDIILDIEEMRAVTSVNSVYELGLREGEFSYDFLKGVNAAENIIPIPPTNYERPSSRLPSQIEEDHIIQSTRSSNRRVSFEDINEPESPEIVKSESIYITDEVSPFPDHSWRWKDKASFSEETSDNSISDYRSDSTGETVVRANSLIQQVNERSSTANPSIHGSASAEEYLDSKESLCSSENVIEVRIRRLEEMIAQLLRNRSVDS